jgi:diamine N-acetyltransferase
MPVHIRPIIAYFVNKQKSLSTNRDGNKKIVPKIVPTRVRFLFNSIKNSGYHMSLSIDLLLTEDANLIEKLAKPIWLEHYQPIIGEAQVKYMLTKFQSEHAIREQISQGVRYFQVCFDELLCGYFAVLVKQTSSLFISKFYLSKASRGKAIGKQMLTYIEELAVSEGCLQLELTVNKQNPAYDIYLKLGFSNKGPVQFDIGGGYIMDDFLMTKSLSNGPKISRE